MLDDGRLLGHEQHVTGPVERVLLLKRMAMVNTLSGAQLALVAEQIGERFFPKGSVLLREGEPPAALYFPVEGRVHLTSRGRVLGHARPGLAVAPFHVLARDEQGLGAVAETDTVALELPADVRDVGEIGDVDLRRERPAAREHRHEVLEREALDRLPYGRPAHLELTTDRVLVDRRSRRDAQRDQAVAERPVRAVGEQSALTAPTL